MRCTRLHFALGSGISFFKNQHTDTRLHLGQALPRKNESRCFQENQTSSPILSRKRRHVSIECAGQGVMASAEVAYRDTVRQPGFAVQYSSDIAWPAQGTCSSFRRMAAVAVPFAVPCLQLVESVHVYCPRGSRSGTRHRHRSRCRLLVRVRSDMPTCVLVPDFMCRVKTQSRTWIKFLPSGFVTSGWSLGVVKVYTRPVSETTRSRTWVPVRTDNS